MSFQQNYIQNVVFEFKRYKTLGDKTIHQLNQEELLWQYTNTDNSISTIVKHLSGNMLSRWTNFLEEDGEKSWRNRENEFINPPKTKDELIQLWERGWNCLFDALSLLNEDNFSYTIKIRNESHTILEAINRQLAHYSNHVGQIVLLGKMIKGKEWVSPSIAKGNSESFNKEKFKKYGCIIFCNGFIKPNCKKTITLYYLYTSYFNN